MSVEQTLASFYMFQGVDRAEVRELCGLARTRPFWAGETIFVEGADADVALLVVSGELEVAVAGHALGVVRAGEVVGEQALFSRSGHRSATVTARTDGEALVIDEDTLVQGYSNAALIAVERHLLAASARRLRRSNLQLALAWKEVRGPTTSVRRVSLVERMRTLLGGHE